MKNYNDRGNKCLEAWERERFKRGAVTGQARLLHQGVWRELRAAGED